MGREIVFFVFENVNFVMTLRDVDVVVIRDQLFTGYSGIQFCFVLKAGSSLNSFFKRMLLPLAFNIEVWKRAGHCALPCVKRKYGD